MRRPVKNKSEYHKKLQDLKAKQERRKAQSEKLERENKDVIRKLREGKPGNLSPKQIDKFRDLLSEQQKERLQKEINKRPKDPEKKFKDNPQDRFGKFRVGEANKGGLLKDILGDKKGTAIYKGKNKDYRILKPVPDKPKPKKSSKGGFFSRSNYKRTGKLI